MPLFQKCRIISQNVSSAGVVIVDLMVNIITHNSGSDMGFMSNLASVFCSQEYEIGDS